MLSSLASAKFRARCKFLEGLTGPPQSSMSKVAVPRRFFCKLCSSLFVIEQALGFANVRSWPRSRNVLVPLIVRVCQIQSQGILFLFLLTGKVLAVWQGFRIVLFSRGCQQVTKLALNGFVFLLSLYRLPICPDKVPAGCLQGQLLQAFGNIASDSSLIGFKFRTI